MNTYLDYYNVYISNQFLKRPKFDAMQTKIAYFYYFPRFIKAVPIMGPGFLQLIFFNVSLHRVLGIGQRIHLGIQKARQKTLGGSELQIDVNESIFFLSNIGQLKLTERFSNIRHYCSKSKDRTTKTYFYDPF